MNGYVKDVADGASGFDTYLVGIELIWACLQGFFGPYTSVLSKVCALARLALIKGHSVDRLAKSMVLQIPPQTFVYKGLWRKPSHPRLRCYSPGNFEDSEEKRKRGDREHQFPEISYGKCLAAHAAAQSRVGSFAKFLKIFYPKVANPAWNLSLT